MVKVLIRLNIVIFCLFIILNFLGVLMPELGFDSLWYHLTLSKLLLFKHQWYFPGGLFYYSAMPRLGELIGLPLLAMFGYVGPKLVQFISSLIICLLIYKLVYRFTRDKLLSLTGINLFYATWLVSWQSSSAYVDLVRTLFEFSALYLLTSSTIYNLRSKILAGLFLGLAIGVKWLSLGTLLLFALVFTPLVVPVALLVGSPWFLIAQHFTGNPLYPAFEQFMTNTQLSQVDINFFSPFSIFTRIFTAPVFLTIPADDFLSPVTGFIFLVSFLGLISSNIFIRKISLFGVLSTYLFLLTPPPSTRYFLPFLPALIISSMYIISRLRNSVSVWIIITFTFSAFLVFGLRLSAFTKFIPYINGQETLNQFLASMSYRLPDTFIDADNYVRDNLPPNANYAISNLHNLYYFPYDFDHDSFVDNLKSYDYLITRGEEEYEIDGDLIHTNPLGIQIFKL